MPYLCCMKSNFFVVVLCLVAHSLNIYAADSRQDTVQVESEEGEIRLSSSFQKELWSAFSFAPVKAPLKSSYSIPLDKSLMKEWLSAVPIKAEIKPLDLPGVITKSTSINPYLWQSRNGKFVVLTRADGTQCISGLDVNALGKYLRPKEIQLRKMQELAAEAREVMDRCYPTEGLATPLPSDTAQCSNE